MEQKYYRRYTDPPSLIHILSNRELTLLNPASWDDRNDSHFMAEYKEKNKLASVLALCFTSAQQTYHHWRVFAPGPSGVCIGFRGTDLRAAVAKAPSTKIEAVKYLKLMQLKKKSRLDKSRLPFIKREQFSPEKETRILWESKGKKCASLPLPIEVSAITRITLSPWMHKSLKKDIQKLIKSIPECNSVRVYRSTLIGNSTWMRLGSEAM